MSIEQIRTVRITKKFHNLKLRAPFVTAGKKPIETYSEFSVSTFNGYTNFTLCKDMIRYPYMPGYYTSITLPTQYAIELFTNMADTIQALPDKTVTTEFSIYANNKPKGNAKKAAILAGYFILEKESLVYTLTVKLNEFERTTFPLCPTFAPLMVRIDGNALSAHEQSKNFTITYFRRLAFELTLHNRYLEERSMDIKNNFTKTDKTERYENPKAKDNK